MKTLFIFLMGSLIIASCNNTQQHEKASVVPPVGDTQESEPSDNTDGIEFPEPTAQAKVDPVKRVLQKKINPETFASDMEIIEASGLYDSAICASFKQHYHATKNYSFNPWSLNYRQALQATKEGIKRAKRIEQLKKM